MDLLFVIDNSCSMAEEQAGLADVATVIIDELQTSGIDYHWGVITTDMNSANESGYLQESQGVRWIENTTVNPTAVGSELMLQGTGGSATERGRDAAYYALDFHTQLGQYNEGFLRDDAHLDVIVLSDEDDVSTAIPLIDFNIWFSALKSDNYQAFFHAIVSPSPTCAGASTPGTDYLNLVNASGGLTASVCDGDRYFQLVLDVLYIHPRMGETQFSMSVAADPTSLAVDETVQGALVNHYDHTQITYDPATHVVTLPVGVSRFSEVVIWYAPAP